MVDDDKFMHEIVGDFYEGSSIVEIKYFFSNSKKFIKEAPRLDFDICLLDINMPQTDGLILAQLLKDKPIIFITGSIDKLKNALDLSPIDVVTKPFTKARLDHAIVKAQKLVSERSNYLLLNVAESNKKLKIDIHDIVLIATDATDARNKKLVLKGGQVYTLMNYGMDKISSMAPHLVKANRSEMVSLDAIHEVQHDIIVLKREYVGNKEYEITLSSVCSKEFKKRFFYK